MIKVIVAGARGRLGKTVVEAITENEGMEVVAAYDYKYDGERLENGEISETGTIPIFTSMERAVRETEATVFLDVTNPDVVFQNVNQALAEQLHVVIGTSGLTEASIMQLKEEAERVERSVIIAPNFSIGAVLMMDFARQAAKYLEDVEIIEMHHNEKLDAPSGTASKTAQMIQEVREPHIQGHPEEVEKMPGARGADVDGMKIHSVRLQGMLAHQQVVFGGEGEMLTIRHDSFDRASFKKGIRLSIAAAVEKQQFIYGLEHLL